MLETVMEMMELIVLVFALFPFPIHPIMNLADYRIYMERGKIQKLTVPGISRKLRTRLI